MRRMPELEGGNHRHRRRPGGGGGEQQQRQDDRDEQRRRQSGGRRRGGAAAAAAGPWWVAAMISHGWSVREWGKLLRRETFFTMPCVCGQGRLCDLGERDTNTASIVLTWELVSDVDPLPSPPPHHTTKIPASSIPRRMLLMIGP
jgi:hypothetical protein